jgi:membrane DNA delivery protein
MSDSLVTSIVTVLTAIIGVAIIAVLVSRQAQTANVLNAGGTAFSRVLGTALSPVTGGGVLGSVGNLLGGTGIGINFNG